MSNKPQIPPCRVGVDEEQLAREAQRSVLYGALLLAQRPGTNIKAQIAAEAQALLPAVQAFLAGQEDDEAAHALAYARACGAEAFLLSKRRPG